MSSTTGLLTLSVHEALTFDGTEVALHPDLFLSAPVVLVPGLASAAPSESRVAAASSSSSASYSGLDAAAASEKPPAAAAVALSPGVSVMSRVSATHKSQTGAVANKRIEALAAGVPLEPGDLICVRVWDARPASPVSDPSSGGGDIRPAPHPNPSSSASAPGGLTGQLLPGYLLPEPGIVDTPSSTAAQVEPLL